MVIKEIIRQIATTRVAVEGTGFIVSSERFFSPVSLSSFSSFCDIELLHLDVFQSQSRNAVKSTSTFFSLSRAARMQPLPFYSSPRDTSRLGLSPSR